VRWTGVIRHALTQGDEAVEVASILPHGIARQRSQALTPSP
jgi:hypothetical protein